MFFGLTSVTMLFLGLTSAYFFRQGSGLSVRSIQMPALLVVNTLILAASSVTMERARRAVQFAGNGLASRTLGLSLGATLLFGIVFVVGQLAVWRQLADKGIYLSTNPHSSFFYLLTGLHGLHLLGGVVALSYLFSRTWRPGGVPPDTRSVEVAAIYWHFMGVLWLYLLMLLFTWS
jgi:cytochrome c oxidase subunit 3